MEKFKLEGGAYRKYVGTNANEENIEQHQKIPLTAYGRPGMTSVLFTLIRYVPKKPSLCWYIKACHFFVQVTKHDLGRRHAIKFIHFLGI